MLRFDGYRDVTSPREVAHAVGEETLLDTNGDGYVSTLIAPDGQEMEFAYDAEGLLTHMVDASGGEHSFAYDATAGCFPESERGSARASSGAPEGPFRALEQVNG
jgi:YD repeat-containing protein